jgi:glycosyltransferase involved in cell wall biosynthesis
MSVSAVIPVYNGEHLVSRAIESVLAQTHPVGEILVVDDGSTDSTADIVRRYGGTVRLVEQKNAGVAAARNTGCRLSHSSWIAFLDHDDEWLPQKIERQMAALAKRPEAKLCYTGHFFCADGEPPRVSRLPENAIWPFARYRNPFPPSTIIVDRGVLLELGGYDERLKGASCEDWDFNVRLLSRHSVVEVPEPLVKYYYTESSNSRRYAQMLANTLAITDCTLLTGLTGADRFMWRRRIRAVLYYRAAISARDHNGPAIAYLLKSLAEWPLPSPDRNSRRARFLAVTLRQKLFGS